MLVPLRHGGHLLGEGLQLTLRVAAEEPAYFQVDRHGPAACPQVMKPSPVPAVNPGRGQPAPMAGRIRRPGPRRDQHGVPGVLNLVDLQPPRCERTDGDSRLPPAREWCTMTLAAAR
jgi:hypothetical protein